MYVEEVHWDNGEIAEKLKTLRISYYSKADKNLKYTTRPGDSERTIRRWKAKMKTAIRMGSLLDYDFTVSSGSYCSDQITNTERNITEGNATSAKPSLGDLLAKVEIRMKERISATEENQLNALSLYYTDLLNGKKKVETSLRIARYTFQNRGPRALT
ncbi:hypothetical protein POJ06DRAFT_46412 [Lipomyces tetrasporus]|uniref:Uncharacterized protein n=1 Tax=Lipomyces tetrasporus TaxID=54092 RepID=A0AAD7VPL3_9ASCO|nr:uncharacterized protein POJ06DRAFT_46412 [Lipomyces tetrasporus]KAJ8096911.1 hypothetical protein POJ06DRAFT_46412 [Lipomyces tetrasporus]